MASDAGQWAAATRARLGRWLQASPPVGIRLVDEAECVLSVLLAITIAHLIGATNISWAAFSGYMVMRGHVADSFLRGVLRVVGTSAGAGLALLIAPVLHHSWVIAALAGAVVGGLSLYGALTGRRAYAWLFIGLTFEMAMLDKLEHPAEGMGSFAATRILEVIAGTGACVAVSALSAVTLRRRWPVARAEPARRINWHPHAFRHAAEGATALALLPPLGALFAIPQLAQGAVSIMAVMLIPVSSVGVSGLVPVSRKLAQRVAGCLAGGALASAFLFAAQGNAAVLLAGTAIGVTIGRHIENGGRPITYVGTQFTLAVLVSLVPDSYAAATIDPALDRLFGILVGLAVLEPVMIGWHLVAARHSVLSQVKRLPDEIHSPP